MSGRAVDGGFSAEEVGWGGCLLKMSDLTAGSYASLLSACGQKGRLNLRDKFDPVEVLEAKVEALGRLLCDSKHVVVHTGAGISTAAGISDFRGPDGIWTKQKKGDALDETGMSFGAAVPTLSHMVLSDLVHRGLVAFIVSQNVDGLHLRSGVPRNALAELHGNVFAEQCVPCGKEYIRDMEVESIGFQETGRFCTECRSPLIDKLLDWGDALPEVRKYRENTLKQHHQQTHTHEHTPTRDRIHVSELF